ncbi:MAG TPA: class I SAM-dependent methyltransferase [Mycobacteriales bacterium]|nr:class I SAM-dependent methyltransferase [Mycobacteriales bacterium]
MAATHSVAVDRSNKESARAWDGDEGAFWAANAERFDKALAGYDAAFTAATAIQPNERVLDIGCGTGQTTRDAARAASAGSALGIDLSAAMLDVARELARREGVGNATFEQADAQIHPFRDGRFDVVVSRTGTMFFGDRDAAFANLARALRPGGRLVTLVWQGPGPNEWIRELSVALAAGRDLPAPPVGAPGPFAFGDPDESRRVLTTAGFTDVQVEPLAAPMWFGNDVEDAQPFVLGLLGWMLQGLDNAGVRRAHDDLRATLARHAGTVGVTFASATWLVSARTR